jgi:hypothetical protein
LLYPVHLLCAVTDAEVRLVAMTNGSWLLLSEYSPRIALHEHPDRHTAPKPVRVFRDRSPGIIVF